MAIVENNYSRVNDLEKFTTDGRLTEPSDGKVFEYHRMYEIVEKLGRPLTEVEAEKFRLKQKHRWARDTIASLAHSYNGGLVA
ncbi:MAG: hypothetical protein E7294_05010 [Lachnospiraceae bacterium]|nr:hypothetical protein [Lachnospiraceae bacterium]